MSYRVYRISSGKTVVGKFESEELARAWLDDYREEKQHFYDIEEVDEEEETPEAEDNTDEPKRGDVVEDDEEIDEDEGLYRRDEEDDDDDDGSFDDAEGFHDADLENE